MKHFGLSSRISYIGLNFLKLEITLDLIVHHFFGYSVNLMLLIYCSVDLEDQLLKSGLVSLLVLAVETREHDSAVCYLYM